MHSKAWRVFMVDLLKYRVLSIVFSLAIVLGFIGTASYRYLHRESVFTYSVDFTGGTQATLRFSQPVVSEKIKKIISKQWDGVTLREFPAQNELLIRVKEVETDSKGLADRMRQAIITKMPDVDVKVMSSESVGAGIGQELRSRSMWAVLIALFALLIYIALTFWSFSYAVGAVVALFHDALVMLAIFLFLDREISIGLIAAMLGVLGYSINDTIVIFSKIRDTFKTMPSASVYDVVNAGINQTLRRTLLTSISTALAVMPMLFLGGEALRDLSLTLLVGIVFGTYSSVYIASQVMMSLYRGE